MSGPKSTTGGYSGKGPEESENHTDSPTKGGPFPSSKEIRDNLRSRYPKGIRPEDLEVCADRLYQAFQVGNPTTCWDITQELLEISKFLMIELAKARFKLNFGTNICERCNGLCAGENVVATCYQIKLCYYRNVQMGKKHQSVIDTLSGKTG
jgi:hypothetical protein